MADPAAGVRGWPVPPLTRDRLGRLARNCAARARRADPRAAPVWLLLALDAAAAAGDGEARTCALILRDAAPVWRERTAADWLGGGPRPVSVAALLA